MKCPFCQAEESKVIDSRVARDQQAIRRRRRCECCQKRFTTYERVESMLPVVVKRDGRREPFVLLKIRAGIELACRKRPVSVTDLDAVMSSIEQHFAQLGEREVPASTIGEVALKHLGGVDEVAYVRFASVYREFSSARQFLTELERLRHESEALADTR